MTSSITLLSHFRRVRQRQPPASGLPLGLLPEIWIEMRSGFLDHDDFGLDQSKIIVIESQSLKRDAGGGWKRPLSAERRASQAEGTECLWQTRS
jgi:hypothetical protein